MATPPSAPGRADFDPLEDILRRCAAAAPAPWYPRDFAKAAGVPLAELAADVEFLWLEGLLCPASRPGDPVPGVTLTDAGARTLADPAALARLRAGPHAVAGREAAARRTLREAGPPVVSRVLLAANLLVFAAGFFLAVGRGAGQAFLAGSGTPAVTDVLHRSGSASADDVIAGQSWRLLASAFVHGGLLHLLMNMSMLAFGCGLAEAMWGRWRYLVIYLIAALGGSCLMVALRPSAVVPVPGGVVELTQPLVGASGALCGVLAATMVWLAFNGRHLPRATAAQLRNGLILSGVLLVFISLFPHVSGLAHLGGVLFGAAAATALHFQRWGKGLVRGAAVVGLVALPWLGLRLIERQRSTDPHWHKAERRVFDRLYRHRIAEVEGEAARLYARRVTPLLNEPPRKRDTGLAERVVADIAEKKPALAALATDLARAGPYRDAEAEKERAAARQRAEELAGQLAEAEDVLRRNANTPEGDEAEERAFSRQFLGRIPDTMRRAITFHRDVLQPLLKTPPDERDPAAVEKAVGAAEKVRRELADLAEALQEAGPYGNEQVEPARRAAERYAAARAAQLEAATRCLRAGDKWTPEDEAALRKQSDEVAALRKEWEQLVERSEAGS
jgi:membrane associated rhomboid family serine protease